MILTLIKALVLPPTCLYVIAFAGLVLARKRPRLGYTLISVALVALLAASLPIVSSVLLRSLEQHPPLTPERLEGLNLDAVDAIVILSGDRREGAPELGGETVGPRTMERLRYGALLHRQTSKPLCLCGGILAPDAPPIARVMKDVLQNEFQVPVTWSEERSGDTFENAHEAAKLLHPLGIRRVLLVTNAWHMPRAVACFRVAGFDVTPAPTLGQPRLELDIPRFIPSTRALEATTYAAYEWFGLAWYHLTKL